MNLCTTNQDAGALEWKLLMISENSKFREIAQCTFIAIWQLITTIATMFATLFIFLHRTVARVNEFSEESSDDDDDNALHHLLNLK